ncbi:MAG: hypothetical protein F4Y87_03045, partial [Synechococcus sp. SB0665_bin_28]|nr:hypothetical protein [Synechococcus sp. SB0665_bin_28]
MGSVLVLEMRPHPISVTPQFTSALGSGLMALSLYAATTPGLAQTDEAVKIGVLFGFTGPIESLTHPMADSAELAFHVVSASRRIMGGKTI